MSILIQKQNWDLNPILFHSKDTSVGCGSPEVELGLKVVVE